jgi:hypothetical protein
MARAKKTKQHVDVGTPREQKADDMLGTLIDWVNESEELCQGARELSEKCRDYYDSIQLSAQEIATLKKRKQAPVVINRIKPKMDTLMGMEKAAKTTAKAFPRTPKHEKAAEAASEAIRFALQENAFDQVRSDVWENVLIEGTGGCEIVAKPKDKGFKILIRYVPWDRLVWDPYSRNKYFTDARYLGQVVWSDYEQAIVEHPGKENLFESMFESGTTYDDKPRWVDTKRRRVKKVELYYWKGSTMYYACFTRGGYLQDPMPCPYRNEEGEHEWPYEFTSAFVDREGNRYGATKQLLDIQDEINKRRSKALHLMSVRQVRWERGAVEDINKARQELAKPDGVLETTPGMEFEVLKTGDMAAAQFNLLTEAKLEIDAVGANAATQGKDKNVQSGVALRERQAAGVTEIGPLFDRLKHFQYRVFRKTYNRIKQYWKEEMWIRVTDDEHSLRWVGLNHPVTAGEEMLRQAQEGGMPPEQLQAMQAQIANDPSMQQVVSTENDIAHLDVDIIVSEVPDVLTAQIEDFQVLGEMVKSGFQMPPEAVIEASPLSNKDKILKMMREQPQIPPQMQKQMQDLQEQAAKLTEENQALKADQQVEAAKLQVKQQEVAADLQMQQEKQEGEMQLERERVNAEIEIKREVAAAELQIDAAKADVTVAIGKIKNMITQHETKMQGVLQKPAAQGGDGEKSGPSPEAMRGIHEEFSSSIQQIIGDLRTNRPSSAMAPRDEFLQAMAMLLNSQNEFNAKLIEAVSRPKVIELGNITRDDSGIRGATAKVH